MSRLIGYARTSSRGQVNSIDTQVELLEKANCQVVLQEKKSGTSKEDREQLKLAISLCQKDDILICVDLDRVARSILDLNLIVNELHSKGAKFKCLNQDFDTTTSSGQLVMNVLGAMAQFESQIRKSRQMTGIVNAKKRGVHFGKKAIVLTDEQLKKAIELKEQGKTSQEVATEFSISRSTLLKKIKEYKERD